MAYADGNEILFSPIINISESKTQEKTIEITENGTTEITADEGFTLSKVTATVNVGGGENKLDKVLNGTVTEITANDLEGITQLRNYAFYHQYELKSIEMANTISGRVGDYAFSNCINLERVVISDNVDRLNRYCFYECKKLTDKSIDFGSGLTWIYDYCFYNCTGLESITFPNQVNTFGNWIFQGCTNLKTVRIGNGVRGSIYAISSTCFQYANNITDIYIDAPENSIYNAPWGATKATIHWNSPLPSEEA